MPAHRTPVDVLKESLRLLEECGSEVKAAAAAGVPRSSFQSRIREARTRRDEFEIVRDSVPTSKVFEEAWQVWLRHIGAEKDRYQGPPKAKKKTQRQRIVAAGDFHVPFHHKSALNALIQNEAKSADVLLIGGDFGDAYAASTFTKYKSVPFEVEHAEKTLVLQVLSEKFQKIVWLKGSNHSDRYEKRLRESLPREILLAVMEMTGGHLNPELVLVRRFPNIETQCWTTPEGVEVPWLTVVGDVAFSHAEKYSRVPGAVLRSVEEWLSDFAEHLGLPPLRAVVQFHTHAATCMPWRSSMILVEPGAMCEMHDYQFASRIGGRPQRLGYVTMELEDDKLDVSSVRPRWLDVELRG